MKGWRWAKKDLHSSKDIISRLMAPFRHLGVGAWDVLWLFCNGDTWPYGSASHGNSGGD